MKIHTHKLIFSLLICSLLAAQAFCQNQSKPTSLTPEDQQQIVSEVSKLMNESYVYAETAKKMADLIQQKLKDGAYRTVTDPQAFANAISTDITSVSKDKHLHFVFDPQGAEETRERASQKPEEAQAAREKALESSRRDNYGFRKAERLPGNIGYLDFRQFAPAGQAGDTAIAALQFLANCDALIIDLRQNGGGDPTQIQLISSYFFPKTTHLNDIYYRNQDTTENYWTYPHVEGKRLSDVDLYILTSAFTFSGAEEFSYNMKNLKRATLIGETTGGGAHPTDAFLVHTDYVLLLPDARAINPITKTNWEGTGVTPDIQVPAVEAYDRAYQMALEKLQAKATDPDRKNDVEWVLASLRAKNHPVQLTEDTLRKYAGKYGERKVTLENGQLFYQRSGPKFKLIPLTETIFALDGLDDFRLEFVEKDGKVPQVNGLYSDGQKEPSLRTSDS